MSSGCRRTRMAVSGAITPKPIAERTIHVVSHPPNEHLRQRHENHSGDGHAEFHVGDCSAALTHEPLEHKHGCHGRGDREHHTRAVEVYEPSYGGAGQSAGTLPYRLAQPKHDRPMPSESLKGLMNDPKLSDPIAILAAPSVAIADTIAQQYYGTLWVVLSVLSLMLETSIFDA